MFTGFDFEVIQKSLPYLWEGMQFSLGLTLLAMLGGIFLGTLLALKGFAAAMLGGMGNPFGALAGGLLLGLLEMPLSAYWRLVQDPCTLNEIAVATDLVRPGPFRARILDHLPDSRRS